jgi:hypothetical protein
VAGGRGTVTLPATPSTVVAGFCGEVEDRRAHWTRAMRGVTSVFLNE